MMKNNPRVAMLQTKTQYKMEIIQWQEYCKAVLKGMKNDIFNTCDDEQWKLNLEISDYVIYVFIGRKHFSPLHESIRRILNRIAEGDLTKISQLQ